MELVLSKKDNRILWSLKILLGLCLATPLLISSNLIFPYTAPKAFAFRILVEVAVVFYFYLALKYSSLRLKMTPLIWSVVIFLGTWFLAVVFGIDWYLSFWGNLERMLGFWGLLHFFLFFLLLTAVFKIRADWQTLFKVSVAVSSLIAILAVLQKFYSLSPLLPQADRVFSVIGNADFLASYLVFGVFFTVYLMVSDITKHRYRWATALGAGLFFQLLALLYTGSRGGLLGLAAGLIFASFLFAFFYPVKKIRRYFSLALALIFILGLSLFWGRNSSLIQKNPILQRITSVSLSDASVQNRLILWQRAWTAWQAQPLFGWGPENNEVALNQYFDPRLNPYEAWYDRAHNFIFDYGVASGWLGLAGYLGMIGAALWFLKKGSASAKKNLADDKEEVTKVITPILFGSLLVAYLVQNLFTFDVFVSYLMLFFTLGLLSFVYTPSQSRQSVANLKAAPLSLIKKALVIGSTLAVFLVIYYLGIRPISASSLASQVLSSPAENSDQVAPLLSDALSLKTFASGEIVYQISLDYLSRINSAPQLTANEDFYKLASGQLQKNIKQEPRQARNYVALAWLDLYFSDQHRERINSALDLAQQVKILSPAKKDAYFLLVAADSVLNDNQGAQRVLQEASAVDASLGSEVRLYWESLNQK